MDKKRYVRNAGEEAKSKETGIQKASRVLREFMPGPLLAHQREQDLKKTDAKKLANLNNDRSREHNAKQAEVQKEWQRSGAGGLPSLQ